MSVSPTVLHIVARSAPRILAECRADGADVDALMTQAWTCPQCRQARP